MIKILELKAVLVKYADGTEENIPVEKALKRSHVETEADKIIRLEKRLETINSGLHNVDLTGMGRKKVAKQQQL